jgi:glutamate synthase (NADPH/NADH) large chain/glutamate synthase (ferredoxin)
MDPLHDSEDKASSNLPAAHGLYRPEFEFDSCGVGLVAAISGKPTHDILQKAIQAVVGLSHRGAVSADGKTGDGAGILTQIPIRIVERELKAHGIQDVDARDVGVGMVFLPQAGTAANAQAVDIVNSVLKEQDIRLLAWRAVPVDESALGAIAARSAPDIKQVLVERPAGCDDVAFERTLYVARRTIQGTAERAEIGELYLPSFSCRTVIYKALIIAAQLAEYYLDLKDPTFETALALFHQRYSSNTFPTWQLAQPFRLLAHNGEINTLWGNRNWTRAREHSMIATAWDDRIGAGIPFIEPEGSDSASLDNLAELLWLSGRDILHTLAMLLPEAWEHQQEMDPDLRAFYEYNAGIAEPWEGPAALTFTDGRVAAACLDRNGLRPARYKVTRDGIVVVSSEASIRLIPDADVIEKGRLGPGEMLAVDTENQRLLKDSDIKSYLARKAPYGAWLNEHRVRAKSIEASIDDSLDFDADDLGTLHRVFGFGNEELRMVLDPMGKEGKDAVWSMGNDTPLAVLSSHPRSFFNYFKQRFAQVTNPPIDSLRESLVMSLKSYIGGRGNILTETPRHAHLLEYDSPLLDHAQYRDLVHQFDESFTSVMLSTLYPVAEGRPGMEEALRRLCAHAEQSIDRGRTVVILTDIGVDADHAPIPILLAASAVHQHLARARKRMQTSIVVETGEVWDIHHFACLLGHGVGFVYPYLALETVRHLAETDRRQPMDPVDAWANYRAAVEDGLLKIMSKMGICTLSGYRGAQIFEIVGLNSKVSSYYFTGTPSRIEGLGLKEIAAEVASRHAEGFADKKSSRLPDVGLYRFRRNGEYHAYSPAAVQALQRAAISGEMEDYRQYADMVQSRPPTNLRDLLEFVPDTPVPIDEVESVESIRRRFTTQAMSMGALSPEAHKAIAVALNRIGGRSNTGEGGEDPQWYKPLPNGESANCAVKQVASARFGVTTEYLVRAKELEIKMAQGSKPGEGGQLPGFKVTPFIARIRHAIPGIPLISPPPHHDIYSIEDIAQLIYDLKQVNPKAHVGVKLVSEAGVGTVAVGVAKAYADYVLISGQDGGTGASPLSSIKNSGLPWELGLAETQQTLMLNNLRSRIRVRVDGGFKTGRDVVVGAMLGAEEFGFGTGSLVAIGCDMARQCHLNTCPTGVATQREDLREKFTGTPDMLVNFLTLIAQEVREILASLGVRSLEEVIGHTKMLRQRAGEEGSKSATIELLPLLADCDPNGTLPRFSQQEWNNPEGSTLDDAILQDAAAGIAGDEHVALDYSVRNQMRSLGARVAGAIADKHTDNGLAAGAVKLNFAGSAGQSFGAFCVPGLSLNLQGEAQDYVGKCMTGGEIAVYPSKDAMLPSEKNVLIGNTCLYGATGGSLFVAGQAGERFAVRNSGAEAVVEGAGDHCCEYMTRGIVAVLGEVGYNFGAGMAAGIAYVLDENNTFSRRYNPAMIDIEPLTDGEDINTLCHLLQRHVAVTGSPRGQEILDAFDRYQPMFWKVYPKPLRALLEQDSDIEQQVEAGAPR